MADFPEWQLGFMHECGKVDLLPIRPSQVPDAKRTLAFEVVANPHLRAAVVFHFALEPDPEKLGCHQLAGTPIAGVSRTDSLVNGIMWSKDT